MNDQLRQTIEIFTGVFPDKGRVIALILDDVSYLCHEYPLHTET